MGGGGKEGDRAPGEAPPTARPGRSPADSPLPQPLPAASGNVPGFPGSPGGGLTHPPGPLYSGRRNYFPSPPLPGPALQSSDKLASRGTEAPPTHGGEQEAPLCTPTPSQECGAGAWTLVEPAALVLAPSLLNWGPVSLGAGCWAWWPQGRPLSLPGVGRDVGRGLLALGCLEDPAGPAPPAPQPRWLSGCWECEPGGRWRLRVWIRIQALSQVSFQRVKLSPWEAAAQACWHGVLEGARPYMPVHTRAHTQTHTQAHTHTRALTHTDTCRLLHMQTHMGSHTHRLSHTHGLSRIHTHTVSHTHGLTHTQALMCTHTHTRAFTHTHRLLHTHTPHGLSHTHT